MRQPPALPQAAPGEIEFSLVERFTGQTEIRSLSAADLSLSRAVQAHAAAVSALKAVKSKVRWARIGAKLLRLRLLIANVPARLRMDRWLVAVVVSLVASVTIALGMLLFVPTFRYTLLLCSVAPFLIVPFCPLLLPLPQITSALRRRREDLLIKAGWEARRLPELETTARIMRQTLERAKQVRDGLRRAAAYPLQRLLSINPSSLDGPQFERYLHDVFNYLRYPVQLVAQSGDQGVDLLVDTTSGRVAVQAKCYSGSVGNAAVQQAFAGMAHYRCQRCAVITNSRFTRSAVDLARSTNCQLIDGSQIPALIRGQIVM